MNPIIRHFFLLLFGAFVFFSCKTSQTVSNDQALLVKNKIVCSSSVIDRDALLGFMRQKPNRKFLGLIRFNKWIYVHNSTDPQTKLKKWLNKMAGEEPVYYDELLATKSAQQMKLWLHSKGYYDANVRFNTLLKNNKAKVMYNISVGNPYIIQTLDYTTSDTAIGLIIHETSNETFLKRGNIFDVSDLEKEQNRIARSLQVRGYFKFTKDYISFAADTSLGQKQVALTVSIAQPFDSAANKSIAHSRFVVQHTYIHTNHLMLQGVDSEQESVFDSVVSSPNTTLWSSDTFNLRASAVLNLCYIKNNEIYRADNAEKSQRRFLEMPLVKSASLLFKENGKLDSSGQKGLNCYIDLVQNKIHAWSFDIEETNTAGDWGTELKTTYTNRNIFRGFERLQVRLRTLLENNRSYGDDFKKVWIFNTLEYGLDANILFPTWISPFRNDKFNQQYTPQTIISAGFSYHQIPYYTRPTMYLTYGYIWKGNSFLTHTFNPIELRGVRYLNKSTEFNKFLSQRYYYQHSYEDYLISSTNYSLVYNKQDANKVENFIYLKFNVESAGNILYGLSSIINRPKFDGKYRLFETQFAQYLKSDIDFRYYMEWSAKSTTVYRIFAGIISPYGNQDVAPNIKRYTAGGASSMRGWMAQSLGPGTYVFPDTMLIHYSSGDVRLEANLEHRFPLFWLLNGAVFTDIGNVWSITSSDYREGARFYPTKFYQDLAVDAGLGLRLDVSFFVFRTDIGIKLRDPASSFNNKWIIGNRSLQSNDFNLTFGIGYPF